jgi:acetyl-CoA acetyltransferase
MEVYGWTQELFAKVASKNKYNGSLNPYAQYQKAMSTDEILRSRVVSWPLTLYMCSTMADGAAAAIVCSKKVARRYSTHLISIAASSLRSGEVTGEDDGQKRAAHEAYTMAGLGPEDIEVAEVHDAMAPGELFRIEKLGFCKAEDISRRVDEGYFTLTGRLPVNTSGGLTSRGHPVGATGLGQIAELVWQMRGGAGARQVRGRKSHYPRVALAQNSGGYVEGSPAALTVTILKV